jgi:hypothetical protein
VKYAIGDKVMTASDIDGILSQYHPGTVTDFGSGVPGFPYLVLFKSISYMLPIAEDEIEPYRSPFRRFLDRFFPKRDPESFYGTEETVERFRAVQQEAKPEGFWSKLN